MFKKAGVQCREDAVKMMIMKVCIPKTKETFKSCSKKAEEHCNDESESK